jgi:uncharacterized membrane protein (UPF0127 family)
VICVTNRSKGRVVAERVQAAEDTRTRLIGLLNRRRLDRGEGLWIPTAAIHTLGMRFAIDAVFLDGQRRVQKVYHQLPPWRITRYVWGARSVLELAAGAAAAAEVEEGDELEME